METAQEKLEAMIAEMTSRLTFDEMTVDPKFYKHIIGKFLKLCHMGREMLAGEMLAGIYYGRYPKWCLQIPWVKW